METSQDIASSILAFSDGEFFGDSRDPLDAGELELLDREFEGLALGGPPLVAAGSETLPLVLAVRESGHHAWAVPRNENTCLIGLDLDRRELFSGPCFTDPKMLEHPPDEIPLDPEPTGHDASSTSVGLVRLDARMVLGLPQRPARYRFAVVAFDWVSNLVEVVVSGEGERTMEAKDPCPPPPEADEDADYPSYLPPTESADDEDENPFDDAGEQTEAQLRLPVLEVSLAADPGRNLALGLIGRCVVGGDPALLAAESSSTSEGPYFATVPMTVTLFALGSPFPARADLVFPCHGTRAPAPGEPLNAFFSLDLLPLIRPGFPPGEHIAYVALEGALVGPIAVERDP